MSQFLPLNGNVTPVWTYQVHNVLANLISKKYGQIPLVKEDLALVSSLNGVQGQASIVAGTNVTVTVVGSTITISSTGGGGGGSSTWGSITGTLSTQTDLQAALDAKASSTHNHDSLYASITHNHTGVYSVVGHGHVIADVTGLQTALDGKAATGHTHSQLHDPVTVSDTASIDLTLTGQQISAAAIFGTTSGTVCQGNDSRLSDARTPTTHTHAASDITSGTLATARLGSGTADSTTYLRGDQTWATVSGGSDPWTYVKLSSDFTTTSATAVDVTGLAFTPAASQTYVVEGQFLMRTATATVGPRPGVAWPTNCTDGVADIQCTSSATANVFANGNITAAVLGPVGGLPNTTASFPGKLQATFIAASNVSGTFKAQLASETAGTTVTMKTGSWIRYRTI